MTENIEMKDIDRGEEEDEGFKTPPEYDNNPEEETRFDGDDEQENEESIILHENIPNIRKHVGSIKRAYTQDKKDFLKNKRGIKVNKTAGPFSKILFDNIRLSMRADRRMVNGLECKGVKTVVFIKGKFDYATAKNKASMVNEFKTVIENAEREYAKTTTSIIEEKTDSNDEGLVKGVIHSTQEKLKNVIEEKQDEIYNKVKELNITDNELREFRGILKSGNASNDDEKLEFLKTDKKYWTDRAEKESDQRRKEFFESMVDVINIKEDSIRLKLDRKPEGETANEILREEMGDLTRFEKFKKWAKRNLISLSGFAITIAGFIFTVVYYTRDTLRQGAHATKQIAKGIANSAAKAVPAAATAAGIVLKFFDYGISGIRFLANNLWLANNLALFITGIIVEKYTGKK